MRITAHRTSVISASSETLIQILISNLPSIGEGSVLAITSKIVALSEGRTLPIEDIDKAALIKQESDFYLPAQTSKYGITLTIKNGILIPTAGIDKSNALNQYVLWPSNSQEAANKVRECLVEKFGLQNIGVIITDSKTSPLRWGTTGIALAHSGFLALNDYVGKLDLFGRPLKITRANVMDMLAVSAVGVMGEGDEQTPLAVIEDLPFVTFQQRNPSAEELERMQINLEDDLYAPILQSANWQKGGL